MSGHEGADGLTTTGPSSAGGEGGGTTPAGAVFQVLATDGQVAGAGFLVGEATAFTCAHVVRAAGQQPGGRLELSFPELPGAPRAWGRVVAERWRSPAAQDIAVLHVADVPPQAVALRVGVATGCRGHRVSSFGFPAQAPSGGHFGYGTAAGLLAGERGAGRLLQLTEANDLTTGFSGAPVIDTLTDLVIGMVTAIASPDAHLKGLNIAYATPAETLRELLPELAEHHTCPYLGLEPFTAQHTEWFHGRETAVEKVLAAFGSNRRLLMLLGPSGAGKTSLVHAGVLPALAAGAVPGSDRWLPVTARPGRDLLAQLAAAGLPGAENGDLPACVGARLAAEPDHDRVLLVIDRFEELLTQTSTTPGPHTDGGPADDARLRAVAHLMALADSTAAVTVLLVMRNDFFAPLEALAPDLVEKVFPGTCNIPAVLGRRELAAIITRPAEAVGLALEAGLADRIVADILATDPSARQVPAVWLPALELALRQLWLRRGDDGRLTHAAYEKIGGVTGSMTAWCNQALGQLPPAHRPVARRILTSLVRPADQERAIPATRQLVPLARLRALAADPQPAGPDADDVCTAVLAALTRYRIITTGTSAHTGTAPGEATAELIHDALLREWADLRDWVAQDQQFQLWLQRAAEQQARHARSGLHGDLLDGTLLAEGIEWEGRRSLPPEITAILHTSTAHQQAALRRTRRINMVLAVLLSIALVATGIAFYQRHTATTAERAAVEAQHQAQSRQLAALSSDLAASDPDLASLLAVKAWQTSPTAEATAAVYTAPAAPLLRLFQGHTDSVQPVALGPDGQTSVTAGEDGDMNLWDVRTGKIRSALKDYDNALWDAAAHGSVAVPVALSPDGTTLATARPFDDIRLWDVQLGKLRTTLKSGSVMSMAFSPDGSTLATGDDFDDATRLWDVQTGKLRRVLHGDHIGDVRSVAFSPDGTTVASVTGDSTVRLWNVRTGTPRTALKGRPGPVIALA
uniref:nSTAND1 domain-containing NTPase n=1 Tax=Streptomyces odontomachi TaxID=2944940 RepID=UPI00210EFA09